MAQSEPQVIVSFFDVEFIYIFGDQFDSVFLTHANDQIL